MITILNSPAEIMMSGNPIAYKLQTDNAATAFFVLRLYVETFFQSGVYENIIDLPSPPDAALQTTIYIDKHLHPCLLDFVPDFSSASAQKATQTVKRYYVELAELSANDSIETGNYTAQAVKYVMKAKHARQDFPIRSSELPNGNVLFKNLKRNLDLLQKDFLSFLPPADVADLQLVLFINYTNATTHSVTLSFGAVKKYEPLYIPIGMVERTYNSYFPALTIDYISITTPYNVVTLRFYNKDYNRTATEIHFYNNLGGLENFIFLAAREEKNKVSQEQMQHYQPYNYTQLTGEFKNYEKIVRKEGTVRTGAVSCEAATYLLDCLESSNLYVRQKNGQFYPAINTTESYTALNTFERVSQFDLNYEYSYNE